MLLSTRAGEYTIEFWADTVEIDAAFCDRIDDKGGPWSMTVLVSHDPRGALCRLQFQGIGRSDWAPPVSVLLVPESGVLFAGMMDATVAIDVLAGRRLWSSDGGMLLWTWLRAGSTVVMVGELELVAYDLGGQRLWQEYIEPRTTWGSRETGSLWKLIGLGPWWDIAGPFPLLPDRPGACVTTAAHEKGPGVCGTRAPCSGLAETHCGPKSPKISTAASNRMSERMMKIVRWRHPPPAAFGSAVVSVGAETSARS